MSNVREDLKKKKPVLGLERTLKLIRKKKVSIVYAAFNSHAKIQLQNLCKSMGVEFVLIQENSRDLGVLCKKPFAVSVISFE